jgi:probable rRNA maturation factor
VIKYFLICQSKHWPARLKKVDNLIKNINNFKNELNFNKAIDYYCNIILTNDESIKKMNFKFSKKNKATDVLTFVSDINFKKNKKQKICDIFLSAEIITSDAKKNNINFYNHLTHLLIHSFLHINGYVHDKIIDFNKMKKIEIKVLNKIGIDNPYLTN